MDKLCCFSASNPQPVGGKSSSASGKGKSHEGSIKYGFSLVKGKANHPMEDYHVAKFVQKRGRELGLFAIYDGHLGDKVAAYLQKHLFSNILKEEEFWVNPVGSISKAYEMTDKSILSNSSDLGHGGSTAVTAIVVNRQSLWVANVGDSRAVLSKEEQKRLRHTFSRSSSDSPMAAASTSMAATAALLPPRVTSTVVLRATSLSSLPYLPPRSSSPASKLMTASRRFASLQIKASSSDESPASIDTDELFTDLKEKWDAVENKSTVILYGSGAIVAVWLSSVVVGAINSIPLLPKILELVGLGYTGWFVYRYLLFKSSRKELVTDIDAIKKKIAGAE